MIAALCMFAQTRKKPVSFARYLDIEVELHICNKIVLGLRKHKILPFVTTWMHLEIILLREIRQTEKVENHMASLTCGI